MNGSPVEPGRRNLRRAAIATSLLSLASKIVATWEAAAVGSAGLKTRGSATWSSSARRSAIGASSIDNPDSATTRITVPRRLFTLLPTIPYAPSPSCSRSLS